MITRNFKIHWNMSGVCRRRQVLANISVTYIPHIIPYRLLCIYHAARLLEREVLDSNSCDTICKCISQWYAFALG